jgi:AcrR family transcriptional regulator
MAQTPLSRLLAEPRGRPDALSAFRLARRWFKEGRRIEMQELAATLGVSRATLFRWVGGRDELLGEVVWSLTQPTLRAAHQQGPTGDGSRVAQVLGQFASATIESEFFTTFVQREPERALRILTTRAGAFQGRFVAVVEEMLVEEVGAGTLQPPLPVHDLAYLVVRICETFIYSDIIAGVTPDPAKVRQSIAALLR